MTNASQQKLPKALIRRTLESARREIEQIERKFHRTIKAVQNGGFSTGRRSTKAATARTRRAAGRSMGRPRPFKLPSPMCSRSGGQVSRWSVSKLLFRSSTRSRF